MKSNVLVCYDSPIFYFERQDKRLVIQRYSFANATALSMGQFVVACLTIPSPCSSRPPKVPPQKFPDGRARHGDTGGNIRNLFSIPRVEKNETMVFCRRDIVVPKEVDGRLVR